LREKEKMKDEKKQLIGEKRRREAEIKRIEWSLNRVKELTTWEASVVPLKQFIRTKSSPHIFYLPKIMNPTTQKLLDDSKIVVQGKLNSLKQLGFCRRSPPGTRGWSKAEYASKIL